MSLGHGITYADLLFKKNANDLMLVTGTNEQVIFKDWAGTGNHSVTTLQMVIGRHGQPEPLQAPSALHDESPRLM